MRKKFCLIITVIIIVVITITTILCFSKRYIGLQKEFQTIFGEDQYLIEIVDSEHTNFYIINDPKNNNFEILKEYMKNLGYYYNSDEQLGTLHYFDNKDGSVVKCDVTYFNNYIECCLHFHD